MWASSEESEGCLAMLVCPTCGERFSVVWDRSFIGQTPEYFPMCGDELGYSELKDDEVEDGEYE